MYRIFICRWWQKTWITDCIRRSRRMFNIWIVRSPFSKLFYVDRRTNTDWDRRQKSNRNPFRCLVRSLKLKKRDNQSVKRRRSTHLAVLERCFPFVRWEDQLSVRTDAATIDGLVGSLRRRTNVSSELRRNPMAESSSSSSIRRPTGTGRLSERKRTNDFVQQESGSTIKSLPLFIEQTRSTALSSVCQTSSICSRLDFLWRIFVSNRCDSMLLYLDSSIKSSDLIEEQSSLVWTKHEDNGHLKAFWRERSVGVDSCFKSDNCSRSWHSRRKYENKTLSFSPLDELSRKIDVVSSSSRDDIEQCDRRSSASENRKQMSSNNQRDKPSALLQKWHLKQAGIQLAVTPTHSQCDQHKQLSH